MSERVRAAEDQQTIWRASIKLRRVCFTSIGLPSEECWCIGAGEDGKNLSCDEAVPTTEFDKMGKLS